jgi:hypothetical protein
MKKHKINTLQDVKNWKALKKEELNLEKLKFDAEKQNLKSNFAKGIGSILLLQGALMTGEKLLKTGLKALFKPSKKEKKKTENLENTAKINDSGPDESSKEKS